MNVKGKERGSPCKNEGGKKKGVLTKEKEATKRDFTLGGGIRMNREHTFSIWP